MTLFAPPDVELRHLPGGGMLLRSRQHPTPPTPTVLHWLAHWAATTPDAAFVTQATTTATGPATSPSPCPDSGSYPDRRSLTYDQSWRTATLVASGLRASGIEPGERVLVAAPNSIEHLCVGLGVMLAGAVYVPMAPQYLNVGGSEKLAAVLHLLSPALAFVADAAAAKVLGDANRNLRTLVGQTGLEQLTGLGDRRSATPDPDPDHLDPNAPTKILLTSGSTGTPKPVAYSQLMMTANTQMTIDVWPFVVAHKPVLVDWLPWNHAFGGNANINLVLSQGGALHIDEGGGRPDGLARTIANLRRLRPTFHGTVPAGFTALLGAVEADPAFGDAFFSRLDVMFTAGAAMHPTTFERLNLASSRVRGRPVPIVTGWGSTEAGPGATMVHRRDAPPGCIGTPLPGVEVKLEPVGAKYELLVRSPSVAAGYWRLPEHSARAFDADGYYRSGDAGLLIDPDRPDLGFRFDGRIADDFKLANGTWVDAAGLRTQLLQAGGGLLRDLVVAGADRPYPVVLAWAAEGAQVTQPELDLILGDHNRAHPNPSRRIRAGRLLEPGPTAAEISAKGQLMRAQVLAARAATIDELYAQDERTTGRAQP